MNKDTYDINVSRDTTVFKFISSGNKGDINKIVKFDKIVDANNPNLYNLAFGDLNVDGYIDDKIRSNNGDKQKILNTVAYIAYLFTNKYPDAEIYFKGSTPARTREYRIG